MNDKIYQVSETLQSAYNEQYTDEMTEWREIGGKYKALNILDVCDGQNFSKVLEYGAGEGSIIKFLDSANKFLEIYAIEISESGISQINKRNINKLKEVKKFNGYEIPYSDNFFDMVYCSHVLEHVEHPRIVLREIKRVSKFQVFEIPLDYSINVDKKCSHFLSYGHINIFTPSLFKFLLKSEGFEIIREKLNYQPEEVTRFNLYRNMKIKYSLWQEIKLKAVNFKRAFRKNITGSDRFQEYGFSTYTCLTKEVSKLQIF